MFDILLERGINSLCMIENRFEIDWGIIEIDIVEWGRGQNQKLQESSLVKPDSTFHTFFTPMQSVQFSVQENEFLQLLILTPTAFGKLLFCSHLIDFYAFFLQKVRKWTIF